MYSHSNNKSITRLLLAIAFVALASLGSVKAQGDFFSNKISLTVNPVMPPYTTKLSDYFTTPGKIGGSIMVNSQIDASSYQFYLHVAIINVETEASVRTRRGFVPSNPSNGGPVRYPQYHAYPVWRFATGDERAKPRVLRFTRGSGAEGLPPGQYRIKLTLFIFPNGWNGFMEVGSKYSPPFIIMPVAVEPPIIIQPHDGAEIPAELTQSLQFTWTMPPGAPASTRYKLKIIEINDPGLNYRDLLRTDAYPAFFETTVTGMPLYLYTVANPAFTEGKSYAFVVRAIDPFGKTNFKNGGYSEVAIFKKKESVMNRIIESLRSYLLPRKTGEE